MPNWCECDLRVKGPTARVREFLEFARGKAGEGEKCDFDFNGFIPYPDEFRERDLARAAFFAQKPRRERTPEEWLAAPKGGYDSGGHASRRSMNTRASSKSC